MRRDRFNLQDHGHGIVGAGAQEEGGARAGVKEDRIFADKGVGSEYANDANGREGSVPGGFQGRRAQKSRTCKIFSSW